MRLSEGILAWINPAIVVRDGEQPEPRSDRVFERGHSNKQDNLQRQHERGEKARCPSRGYFLFRPPKSCHDMGLRGSLSAQPKPGKALTVSSDSFKSALRGHHRFFMQLPAFFLSKRNAPPKIIGSRAYSSWFVLVVEANSLEILTTAFASVSS